MVAGHARRCCLVGTVHALPGGRGGPPAGGGLRHSSCHDRLMGGGRERPATDGAGHQRRRCLAGLPALLGDVSAACIHLVVGCPPREPARRRVLHRDDGPRAPDRRRLSVGRALQVERRMAVGRRHSLCHVGPRPRHAVGRMAPRHRLARSPGLVGGAHARTPGTAASDRMAGATGPHESRRRVHALPSRQLCDDDRGTLRIRGAGGLAGGRAA